MRLRSGGQFLSREIRKNFYSFYDFSLTSDSLVVNDQLRTNDLPSGLSSIAYGDYGKGGKYDGTYASINIDAPVTSYPYFVYASIKHNPTTTYEGLIKLSPRIDFYPSNYLEGGVISISNTRLAEGDILYNNASDYRISETLNVTGNVSNVAMVVRGHSDYNLYVNGSKGNPLTSSGGTPSLTPLGLLSVGYGSPWNVARGIMFFAGYGIVDPGDAFFRRLTSQPLQTIYQKKVFYNKIGTPSIKFRRTMSLIGSRVGCRGVTA